MTITTLSSREFNQNRGRATKASDNGPVIITDRGKPSHVYMTYEEYRRITGTKRNLIDALAMPGLEDIEDDFEFPRIEGSPRKIDFDFD